MEGHTGKVESLGHLAHSGTAGDHRRLILPGRTTLTLWLPTADCLANVPGLPLDDRPLTSDQLGRLRHAAGALPDDGSAPWIAVTTLLTDADNESVAGALRRFFDRHESLRAAYSLSESDDGEVRFERRIVPAGSIRFDPQDLGTYDDRNDAWDVVAREFAQRATALSWPAAALITATSSKNGKGGETIVLAAFDHVTFDGYSAYLAVDELPHLHRNQLAGLEAEARAGSYLDFAVAQRIAQSGITPDSDCLSPWREALDHRGNLPGLPSATRVSRDMALPHVMDLLLLATPQDTAAFVTFCRTRYVPVGLGFTALLLLAIQAEEAHDRITVLMSTHNRDQPQFHHAIGWFAGVAPLTVELPGSLELTEAMRRVAEAWLVSSTASILTVPLVNRLLGAKATPSIVLSYLDSHRCAGWQDWTRNRAEVFLGPIPPSDQMHLWINVMPDQTELLFRIPDTGDCRDWMIRVANRMREALEQIAAEPTTVNGDQL